MRHGGAHFRMLVVNGSHISTWAPVVVGISQRGLIRCDVDSEVNGLAQTKGKPTADLVRRVRIRQFAEQHRDQLRPATDVFASRSACVS
jgi:hypothetical protein